MASKEQVLQKFMESKEFKRIQAEIEAEEASAADRGQWAAELQELTATREQRLEPLRDELRQSEKAVGAARDELRKALSWRTVTENSITFQIFRHDSRTEELSQKLKRTAPAALLQKLEGLQTHRENVIARSFQRESWPDIPENFGFSRAEMVAKQRERTSSYEQHLQDIAGIDMQIDQVKAEMLKGA